MKQAYKSYYIEMRQRLRMAFASQITNNLITQKKNFNLINPSHCYSHQCPFHPFVSVNDKSPSIAWGELCIFLEMVQDSAESIASEPHSLMNISSFFLITYEHNNTSNVSLLVTPRAASILIIMMLSNDFWIRYDVTFLIEKICLHANINKIAIRMVMLDVDEKSQNFVFSNYVS